MKKDYVNDVMSSTRILSHGKIADLSKGFVLPSKEAFSIFLMPKQGYEITDPAILLNVRLSQDEDASNVPVLLNEWSALAIEEIAAGQQSVLDSVDIYWGGGNYITNGSCKVITAPTAKSLVYNGEVQELVNAGVGSATMMYSVNDGEFSANIPTAANVGVYDVKYKVVDLNGLNADSPVETVRCAIAEKFINNPTIELTPSSFTYNGSACVPEVVVKDGDRVIPASEYTVEISNNINAGTANVVIRDNVAGNYEVLGTTTFNIAKASRTISFVTIPKSLGIDESSVVAAVPSAGVNDGTISYSSSDSTKISVEGNVITGVDSGNATITAAISEGTNYLGATVTSSEITVSESLNTNQYLTFIPVEDSTFKFSKAGLSYSLDDGSTWTELAANTDTPTVPAESKILWKNNTTLTPSSSNGIGAFSSSKNFDASGNVMSLLFGDNFAGQTSLSGKAYAFHFLFKNSKVRNAENLALPATTLASGCYTNMFYGCTSLTAAPELPATTLASGCYSSMFYGCTNLNYIKMLATDISATNCLDSWVRSVAASGTFVKADGVTIPSGTSGIPEGWTVETVNA